MPVSGAASASLMPVQAGSPTPVVILTGFLGAGKTSVLQKMLAQENYGDTAVLINEFGEIGIDQQLITPVSPDMVLLDSGCLCCQIRGELKDALVDLLDRRARGQVPPFRRVVIETTGLAEPTPIIATLQADPLLCHQFCIAGTVTVVDALHGGQMADTQQPVWMQQVAAADAILVTKQDLAPVAAEGLAQRLSRLLPDVAIIQRGADDSLPDLHVLLAAAAGRRAGIGADAGTDVGRDAATGARDDARNGAGQGDAATSAGWPPTGAAGGAGASGAAGHLATLGEVRSLSLTLRPPLDWTAFGLWLSALLHVHGRQVLRVKGILDIGAGMPVLINGVQHMIHPPQHLPGHVGPPGSRLVFITRDLDPGRIESSLRRWVLSG